jgi:hypothetical protein
MATLRGPRPPERKGARDRFCCGVSSLYTWLIEYAQGADSAGSARTYVVIDEEQNRVVSYYALTVASLEQVSELGGQSRLLPHDCTVDRRQSELLRVETYLD